MRFTGKTAFITGGGGCIGGTIARLLAAEGARVAICDINTETAEKSVEAANKAAEDAGSGGEAFPIALNVCDNDSIEGAMREATEKLGHVDILVNVAGGSARSQNTPLKDQQVEVIDRILNVNLRGAMLCTRAALKYMTERKYGRIVNIASIVGIQGSARLADYSAAKAGVIAFTRTVAMEAGADGITANCVSPGLVPRPGDRTDHLPATNFLHKVCTPEDVAKVVLFLASDDASFITGQNYVVDGGRSLGLKGNRD